MDVFLEENKKLNLSALRTPELCWTGNVLDSLAFLKLLPQFSTPHSPLSILDMGTGGGFPLLPLALCLPEVRFAGLDATRKKIDAVSRIEQALGIVNAELLCGRAETLGHDPSLRETFDVVLSRAVAPVNVLLEYCAPFARPGGAIVLWKSLRVDAELQESLLARAELSCHLARSREYDLGGTWGRRQMLVFEKASALPDKYPRGVGVPGKDPLK